MAKELSRSTLNPEVAALSNLARTIADRIQKPGESYIRHLPLEAIAEFFELIRTIQVGSSQNNLFVSADPAALKQLNFSVGGDVADFGSLQIGESDDHRRSYATVHSCIFNVRAEKGTLGGKQDKVAPNTNVALSEVGCAVGTYPILINKKHIQERMKERSGGAHNIESKETFLNIAKIASLFCQLAEMGHLASDKMPLPIAIPLKGGGLILGHIEPADFIAPNTFVSSEISAEYVTRGKDTTVLRNRMDSGDTAWSPRFVVTASTYVHESDISPRNKIVLQSLQQALDEQPVMLLIEFINKHWHLPLNKLIAPERVDDYHDRRTAAHSYMGISPAEIDRHHNKMDLDAEVSNFLQLSVDAAKIMWSGDTKEQVRLPADAIERRKKRESAAGFARKASILEKAGRVVTSPPRPPYASEHRAII